MLEKWICLLEESGIPWDIRIEGVNTFSPRIYIQIIAENSLRYELVFEYDSGEEKIVMIGYEVPDE